MTLCRVNNALIPNEKEKPRENTRIWRAFKMCIFKEVISSITKHFNSMRNANFDSCQFSIDSN